MKRQCEELFFNYVAHPKQNASNSISYDLPEGFVPLPGDIIEIMATESGNTGYVANHIRVVCYVQPNVQGIQEADAASLGGHLANPNNNNLIPLVSANIQKFDGIYYLNCFAAEGVEVEFQPTEPGFINLVNMIVHRSMGKVELYVL